MEEKNYENIVIRMPHLLGDCVMATPIISDLKKAYPEARITVMVVDKLGSLFRHDSEVDEIIEFSRYKGSAKRQEKRRLISILQSKQFDLGVLLVDSFSSAYLFWKAGIDMRIGFSKDGRRPLLTQPVPLPPNWQSYHFVDRYKMLLKSIGIKRSRTLPRVVIADKETKQAKETFASFGIEEKTPIVGFDLFTSVDDAKFWSMESYTKLASFLDDEKVRIACFGDSSSRLHVNAICDTVGDHVINLAKDYSVQQVGAFVQHCDVIVSGDTGLAHIAAAVGTPVVALFGPTSELLSSPYTNLTTIVNKHVACSPCMLQSCPIDHRCMTQIFPEEILNKVLEWIKRGAKHTQSVAH